MPCRARARGGAQRAGRRAATSGDGRGAADARRARVEPRQLRLSDGDDRDASRLEVLERGGHVEDGLGAGTHDRHRRPAELLQIRRDVEGGSRSRAGTPSAPRWTPPMPPVAKTRIPAAWAAIIVAETVVAAQPPPASAAARRRPGRFAHGSRQVRSRAPRAVRLEPDEQPPAVDRDGRRHRAGIADGGLRGPRDLEVVRVRQAVADQRRFERDDGPARAQGAGDLGRDLQAIEKHRVVSVAIGSAHDMARASGPFTASGPPATLSPMPRPPPLRPPTTSDARSSWTSTTCPPTVGSRSSPVAPSAATATSATSWRSRSTRLTGRRPRQLTTRAGPRWLSPGPAPTAGRVAFLRGDRPTTMTRRPRST